MNSKSNLATLGEAQDALEERLAALSRSVEKRLAALEEKMAGNLVAGLEDQVCDDCKAKGKTAVKFKCTSCGRESWWGFWPEKKAENPEKPPWWP